MQIQEFLTQNDESVISFQALLWLKELQIDLDFIKHWKLSSFEKAILMDSQDYVPQSKEEQLMIGIANKSLSVEQAREFEVSFEGTPQWWVLAARYHALHSQERESRARIALSTSSIPFVFPGDVIPLQIEILAAGESVLSVLHADLNRKLSDLVLKLLPLDAKFQGGWFLPLLSVLNENVLRKQIKALLRRLKNDESGIVLLYAYHLGIEHQNHLNKASKKSVFLYLLGKELARKIG